MSFLLDTNICSTHLRGRPDFTHKLIQYSGRLFISSTVLAEISVWAYRQNQTARLAILDDLLQMVVVLPFEETSAHIFGKTRASLLNEGISVNVTDLLIAATALAHNLTLVTHNTKDFANIPGLRVEDWLVS